MIELPESGPWKRKEVIGNAVLLLGDCLEILPHLPKVDAVITDPPYGMNLDTDFSGFTGFSGKATGKKYAQVDGDDRPFNPAPILAAAPISLLWGAQWFCHKLPISGGWLVFNKRGDGKPSEICFGDAELAWCNRIKSVRLYSQMWHGVSRWSTEGALHPTQKPIGLMEWCIKQAGDPASIMDPYMGSGTTGIACHRLGKRFVGVELNEAYFDIACERIENAQRQERLFA